MFLKCRSDHVTLLPKTCNSFRLPFGKKKKMSNILSIPWCPDSLIYLICPLFLHLLSLLLSSSSLPLSPSLPSPCILPPDPMNNTVFAFASRLSNKLTLPHQMPCFPHPPHFTLLTSTHFFNSHCRSYILTRYTERSESPIRQDHGMLCFTYGLSYINIYCFIYIY